MTCKISAQYVKACRRKVWKTVTDGRRPGRTKGHHHTIICPVLRRAYKKHCAGTKSLHKVQFVTLTFDSNMWRYLPRAFLHLCMEHESCMLKTFTSYCVRIKVLTWFSLWPWLFDPKIYRYLSLTIIHLGMKYKSCMLKLLKLSCHNQSINVHFVTLTFESQNVKVSSSHHPAYMYEIYMNHQVGTKRWQSSICDLLIPKRICIFISPSCIVYVWNLYAENNSSYGIGTKVLQSSVLWPWLLTKNVQSNKHQR